MYHVNLSCYAEISLLFTFEQLVSVSFPERAFAFHVYWYPSSSGDLLAAFCVVINLDVAAIDASYSG